MSNENISNNFKIVFDANSSATYDDNEHNNEQTTQPQLQPQEHLQQITETEDGKQGTVRSFRGVNWDDVSTNLLLDIYKSKFPLLESTPHNKGRKQIYEEMRAEFNSNEHIENKRTLKSLTRKWGEMLAKYRIRRGVLDRTGQLPEAQWKYHDRMHEIVGHLPPNGRLSFPMTNTTIESNSFITEKINTGVTSSTWVSASIAAAETSTMSTSDKNTTCNKRTRTEEDDENNENNSETADTQTGDGTLPALTTGPQARPMQSRTPVQETSPNHGPTTKVPRRIEPKRTPTSSNNNNRKGRGQKKKDTPIVIRPASIHDHSNLQNRITVDGSSIQTDHHDLRNTLEQILETGRRAIEPSTVTGQAISESLRIIAEASRQMAESNRLLAKQIENNSKTTEILLEGMKSLITSINTKDGNHDGELITISINLSQESGKKSTIRRKVPVLIFNVVLEVVVMSFNLFLSGRLSNRWTSL
ncbi:hypothetical protein K501DRAFT_338907 [Backusella circina FSU 941]|nr:hypothetical protein K501DRAFT_338907 [Backusella circina FSU 941]